MKDCVYAWRRDPSVAGQHRLTPVTYSELVERLVDMVRSTSVEHLSSTDSEIVTAAIKLCNKPIVIQTPTGELNLLCAEDLNHQGFCVSKEGYIKP